MGNTFLKWAGGKHWFVCKEQQRFPNEYNRYIEPFLGGSCFFHLQPQNALLSDINSELIDTYIAVRDNVDKVYQHLRIHANKHCEQYYYTIRERKTITSATSAARMIYLNKACYNGIYRVNRSGKFNVPYGTATKLSFDKNILESASKDLKHAEIICQDLELSINQAQEGDFLFCDPPYAVIDNNNRFVGYNADAFSWDDQIRLSNALIRAKNRNVKIIMTNVDHENVRALYQDIEGFTLDRIQRQCFISGTLQGRRQYLELIVTANL